MAAWRTGGCGPISMAAPRTESASTRKAPFGMETFPTSAACAFARVERCCRRLSSIEVASPACSEARASKPCSSSRTNGVAQRAWLRARQWVRCWPLWHPLQALVGRKNGATATSSDELAAQTFFLETLSNRPATFQRTLQRQADQAIHQLVQRHAAPLPETRVHADRCEPGDGIHLVDIDLVAAPVHEEIDPRHAGQIEGAKCGNGHLLDLGHRAPVDRRRNQQLGVVIDVLGVVVVELVAGNDLADDRGNRLVVAEHRDLQLASVDRFLDQDAAIETAGLAHSGRELTRIMRLDHTHTRAHVCWLY